MTQRFRPTTRNRCSNSNYILLKKIRKYHLHLYVGNEETLSIY